MRTSKFITNDASRMNKLVQVFDGHVCHGRGCDKSHSLAFGRATTLHSKVSPSPRSIGGTTQTMQDTGSALH
ncbi:hypothetical protein FOMPIDRAFT_1025914 [Fomitopsis schrenkii]|uniref:Uncharacterized protein n=1 Tax=Fomitopsis schrenkii TaxID=2126942 RepID=S8F8X2_FOMSC|nr:hypothetical protein FOMPIDRAFT_1025914 [Fomitopsis schrenkii]